MSRLLKQVYSQNIYVEFRFESSLRKYDKKPTKKIKCQAFCKHCINHHKKIEYSPLKQTRPNIQYRSKFKKSNISSVSRPQQKSIISSCKTMKLSKQKSQAQNDQNLLQIKLYRGLIQQKHKENDKIQKSQEENSSSMEEEIYFNQFGHSPQDQSNKDSMDKDFDRIEITNRTEVKQEKSIEEQEQIKFVQEISVNKSQEGKLKKIESVSQQKIQKLQQNQQIITPEALEIISDGQLAIQAIFQEPIIAEQPINQNQMHQQQQIKPQQPIFNNILQNIQENTIENQSLIIVQNKIFQDASQLNQCTIKQNSDKQLIQEKFMAESMMDKCLLFQGGRIYVDTSGQNFYISVRVFNKLRRKYANTQELTNILIQQRPCLQQKKNQIKHQLEEYLQSLI